VKLTTQFSSSGEVKNSVVGIATGCGLDERGNGVPNYLIKHRDNFTYDLLCDQPLLK
jgi:hypothetical protein